MNNEYVCPKCGAKFQRPFYRSDPFYEIYLFEYLIHLIEHLIEKEAKQ